MAKIDGVSILVISNNNISSIERAIKSALDQVVAGCDVEVLIGDCGSTDGTWDVIGRLASQDGRLVAFRHPGPTDDVGRKALEQARYERVVLLPADAFLLPGHVARALAVHAEHIDVDFVYTSYVHVDQRGRFSNFVGHQGHLRGSFTGGRNEFAALLSHDMYMAPATVLHRRETVRSFTGDPWSRAGAYELVLKLAAEGASFAFLDTPGAAYAEPPPVAMDPYVASGEQLRDHLTILERFLTPEFRSLFRGHESAIGRLLQAKLANLGALPDGPKLIEAHRARLDAIADRLNRSLSAGRQELSSANPLINVILVSVSDPRVLDGIRATLESQSYTNWRAVVVCEAPFDAAPLVRNIFGERALIVSHRSRQTAGVSLNDATELGTGEITVYLSEHVEWPRGHLESIVGALRDSRIDAVTVPVDFVVTRAGVDVARYKRFTGGTLAESASRIGEAVPLFSIAHRTRLIDLTRRFEEAITFLIDFDFVQRILSQGPLGILDSEAITFRAAYDVLHPGLSDPNGYMATLRAIYNGRPVEPRLAQLRESHFGLLTHELHAMAATPDTARAHLFWAKVRGGNPPAAARTNARKRILVIDDCVPYVELGRGYPRARAIIEDLRDAGYEVAFYPLVRPYDDAALNYGIDGVEILYGNGPELLGLTLDARLEELDLLWVSRPHNMRDVQSTLRAIGRKPPPVIYDAEAVYVERDRVRAEVEGKSVPRESYENALARELSYTDGCTVVSAVSIAEKELISTRFNGPIEVLSFAIDANPTMAPFAARQGILFVGAIEENSPNDDALFWFSTEVLPLIHGVPVRHAGVMQSSRLRGQPVDFIGVVPDLRPVYNLSKIFIAPTRFAAGLPQKVYEAAANGLPIIASPLIAQQLGWVTGEDLLVANTPQEWATAIDRLNTDPHLWERLRAAALARVRAEASPEAFRQRVVHIARLAAAEQLV